jgi:hypothetical protein
MSEVRVDRWPQSEGPCVKSWPVRYEKSVEASSNCRKTNARCADLAQSPNHVGAGKYCSPEDKGKEEALGRSVSLQPRRSTALSMPSRIGVNSYHQARIQKLSLLQSPGDCRNRLLVPTMCEKSGCMSLWWTALQRNRRHLLLES